MVKELTLLQNVLCALRNPDNVLRSIVLVDFTDLLVGVFDMELLFQLFRFPSDRVLRTFHGFHPVLFITLQHEIIMPAFQVKREHYAFKLHIHTRFLGHIQVVRPILCNSENNVPIVFPGNAPSLLAKVLQAACHAVFLQGIAHSHDILNLFGHGKMLAINGQSRLFPCCRPLYALE